MEEWLKSTKCAKTGRGSCGRGDKDHPGVERFLLPAAIGETWLLMTGAKMCNYFFAHVELGFCFSQNKYEKLKSTIFDFQAIDVMNSPLCYPSTPQNKQSSVVTSRAWFVGGLESGILETHSVFQRVRFLKNRSNQNYYWRENIINSEWIWGEMVNRKDFLQNSNQMMDLKIHNPIILSKLIVIRGWGWRSLWGLNLLVDQLYKWGNFGGTGEQRFIYFFYKFYWFIYLFYKRPVIARRGNQLLFCLFRPHPSINSTQQISGIGYQTKT